MPGQPTTQKDRENITARLFRREAVPDIARSTGISKKTIWRISYNLKTYGTAVAPREDKPRGRPPLLTKEEHEALAQFMLENPIAVREDMIQFIKERFGKEVNSSCVTHAIKRLGFTRIIIMRGLWATRHDLPPEAARVHAVAAEAIDRQMRLNAELKAEHVKNGNSPVAQNKGRYAWVRLHPGEDTGFNPRQSKGSKRWANKESREDGSEHHEDDTSTPEVSTDTPPATEDSMIPYGYQEHQEYVSPYS